MRRKSVNRFDAADKILDAALKKYGLPYRNLLEPQLRYALGLIEEHYDIMTKKENRDE